MVQDRITLPGLEQAILRLADWIACHELRAVRGQPGGVVARRAPAARIERAATVRAQLAYHKKLEVFRRELRQFGHRSTLLERRTQTLRQRAQGRQIPSR